MRITAVGGLTVALLVAACSGGELPGIDPGVDGTEPGDGNGSPTTAPLDLPACPAFDDPRDYSPPPAEQPETDAALTSSEPVEDTDLGEAAAPADPTPMSAAQRWAEAEAPEDFAGVWFDQDHGAAVIAFTDDLDRYAEEVRRRFGAGWWVVRAEHAAAELRDLTDAVGEVLPTDADGGQPGSIVSWGPREDRGVVGVEVVGGDDAALAELAASLDDPAYCFTVLDPPAPPDVQGPVRTLATVDGWRDGLEVPSGALLEIAFDDEAAQRLVTDNVPADLAAGPDGEPWVDGGHHDLADVDLATHVVAVYSAGRSGSCPEWVADVAGGDAGVAVTTEVPTRGACTDDFNPYRTVIVIDRDRLPTAEDLPAALDRGYDVVVDGAVVRYPSR